ncbi:hypothetical protein HanRHA438_Chr10g0441381 [Helianthus annuus]|nr:hypothetical protein HanIR_Chr10g0462661 [Helianthus annuus]KAJ0878578.1 hypothetical protein HanRHA438_Chr10g0441381 [Helianthus annuus]
MSSWSKEGPKDCSSTCEFTRVESELLSSSIREAIQSSGSFSISPPFVGILTSTQLLEDISLKSDSWVCKTRGRNGISVLANA